jgi:hypothetical protein
MLKNRDDGVMNKKKKKRKELPAFLHLLLSFGFSSERRREIDSVDNEEKKTKQLRERKSLVTDRRDTRDEETHSFSWISHFYSFCRRVKQLKLIPWTDNE